MPLRRALKTGDEAFGIRSWVAPTSLTSDALPSTPPIISDFAINNDFPISDQFYILLIDPNNTVTGVDYVIGTLDTLTSPNRPHGR